jgi:hypothetical protein
MARRSKYSSLSALGVSLASLTSFSLISFVITCNDDGL